MITKMKIRLIQSVLIVLVLFTSCKQNHEIYGSNKETTVPIFPKGEIINNDNFIGTAWLNMLVVSDSINRNAVGSVTLEPGARSNWHTHPNGQIILALGGTGYYQEKGSAKKILKKGDVVKCPPNLPHWHGASATKEFVQIAVTSRLKGPTEWLYAVTDKEYTAGDQ